MRHQPRYDRKGLITDIHQLSAQRRSLARHTPADNMQATSIAALPDAQQTRRIFYSRQNNMPLLISPTSKD
ncbi:hypothetical protein XA68_13103 [Ophiocordyceps unilateralis]|uniref:Uncharacterized protein n=1 Tax=Ophiocordyceps unilateralis TaxID=268505 RepID=A0A2A9PBF7_OPHUN|nr:hypothetical protein XA68_13103 [Ophiocordyceps unilateralis]